MNYEKLYNLIFKKQKNVIDNINNYIYNNTNILKINIKDMDITTNIINNNKI